jgi:hypothetical protein
VEGVSVGVGRGGGVAGGAVVRGGGAAGRGGRGQDIAPVRAAPGKGRTNFWFKI